MYGEPLPDVVRTGNRCLLDCDARLRPLFARSFPDVDVVSGYSPENSQVAAHLPCGGLPGLFRTTDTAFAAITSPYLVADPVQRNRFRTRYADGGRLVSPAWHTRNQNTGRCRSMELSLFAPLFKRSDIKWISLQYGDHEELQNQASATGAPVLIDRSVDQFSDIDLFAAQITAMDMVVTIDYWAPHSPGTRLPAVVLLPYASDWRWLQAREDSLWYPSLRLIRQPKPGDWQSAVQRLQTLYKSALRVIITSSRIRLSSMFSIHGSSEWL